MPTHVPTPTNRLIRAGQAKARTNANGGEKDELDRGLKFD